MKITGNAGYHAAMRGVTKCMAATFAAALLLALVMTATAWGQGGPNGAPGTGGPGGPPPGGGAKAYTLGGTYTLKAGTKAENGQRYLSDKNDVSAVYVSDGGNLTLNNPAVTTSGNTSSNENSSFYGLNAAVLSGKASKITINGGTISTTGEGANGAFATDSGSTVNLAKVTIKATGAGGHGVMASNGGVLNLTDVDITTSGRSGAPVATDRGSGTVNVTGGNMLSSGQGSPGIYSTGVFNIKGGTYIATGAEGAVIEGANSINLTDTTLKGEKLDGAMIYQSFSGDAEGQKGVFTMTGGSFEATVGPLFLVTNTNAVITLKDVKTIVPSGTLVQAGAMRWGNSGSNGGHVRFTADAQTLTGNLIADNISTIAVTLENASALTGSIDAARTAKTVDLTLDETSKWKVSADSYLTSLTDPGGISGNSVTNINGNGHTVYYNAGAAQSKWLDGKTYDLAGGGKLVPAP